MYFLKLKNELLMGFLTVGFLSQAVFNNDAMAVPILPPDAGAKVQTRNLFDADNNTTGALDLIVDNQIVNGTSHAAATTQSAAFSNVSVSSQADLTTGEVKAFASSTYTNSGPFIGSVATVNAFDVLTFNLGGASDATISYDFSIDGTLSNSDPTDALVDGAGGFFLYDITGQTNAFSISDGSPGTLDPNDDPILDFSGTVFPDDSSPLVAFELSQFFVGTADHSLIPFLDPASVTLDSSGNAIPFNSSETGSFTVFPDRVYGIQLFAQASVEGNGPSTADVSNTGTFRFTDLGGATFASASGGFLTNVNTNPGPGPAPVPEPSTFLLLGSGLAGLVGWRYRKRNRS